MAAKKKRKTAAKKPKKGMMGTGIAEMGAAAIRGAGARRCKAMGGTYNQSTGKCKGY